MQTITINNQAYASATEATVTGEFVPQPPGTPAPDGYDVAGRAWARVRFDIILAPAGV